MSATVSGTGKRQIVFNKRQGFTDMPMEVPCGRCIGCRMEKAQQWATRCMHEASLHADNCFITLTYNDENLPRDWSLNKSHFQLFMKRLRKRFSSMRFRFYMCGEYGDQNGRPHYHALLFGLDFPDKKVHSKSGEKTHYTSDILAKVWGMGHVLIGPVNPQTAAYCARYNLKKVTGEMAEKHYQRINSETGEYYQLQPEYTNMSLKPGIGAAWFDKYQSDCYPSDFIVVAGQKKPVPQFYDKKLRKGDEALYERIKKKRVIRALQHKSESTPERLAVREECLTARTSTLKRNL